MKELIRGVACLALALGATACEDDPSIDFGGSPTLVQLSPNVMFITSGNTKELLARLVNDRNQSVPTSFTVSNVGAGLNVIFDTLFRPQQTIKDPVLTSPLIKTQQRYFIEANLPVGGQSTFTLTSGGISGSPTINIEPTRTGALSATAPALGEEVTIAAPPSQSFAASGDTLTTVFFVVGTDTLRAVITELTTSSVSFLPLPGSAGPAFVTRITLNFAPTLAPRRLETLNAITTPVPVVASAPLVVAAGGVHAPRTVSAAGFKFLPNFSMTVGGVEAYVVSVAADSNSAQVIVPAAVTAEAPVLSGIALNILTAVSLSGIPSSNTLTTATTPYNGSAADGNALVINALDPLGTQFVVFDTPINFGPDNFGLGGPTKWYRLVVPSAGVRTVTVDWTDDAAGDTGDFDFEVCNDALTACPISRLTGAHPEFGSANLAAGNYWIAVANFANGPVGMLKITIE
ncbi:MAG: hypothetical protein U0974_13585 [Gemmatimonadales bacterium]|nr:hypothetical protein [Gemmatimonadales bacterium]MDZ4390752.1 hypothetical protein [Gemmatimonadales bacterium]